MASTTVPCMTRASGLPSLRQVLPLLALLALAWSAPALGEAGGTPRTEVPDQADADRLQKLIAGARKEGAVTVYSSAASEDLAALVAAFEKKYGVKVRLWRASSENILQRAVTEARGGRFDADVLETG